MRLRFPQLVTRPGLAGLALLTVSVGLATPALLSAAAENPAQVAIAKFAYGPNEITVAPGTTVVWTNQDETPHTVTSKDRSFSSKGLDTGDRFEHTFSGEGDFAYLCTVHPYMTGTVHVRK